MRPSLERLQTLVAAMSGQRVLMVVDLVADRFLTGRATRLSREAPVLILEQESDRIVPGGGANAVANVRALGGLPVPVGVVGDDPSGVGIATAFDELGVPRDGILELPGLATPTKTRILGGSRQSIKQQIVRIDSGQRRELRSGELEELERRIGELGRDCRVAVASDYGYGAVSPRLLAAARRALLPDGLVLGDSRAHLLELDHLDGATPNQEEAEQLLGASLDEVGDVRRGGPELLRRLGGRFLLITLGSRGMALFEAEPGGRVRGALLPVFGTDQVADVTGAGDTVIGTFALALAAGGSPIEASLLATYAAGLVVMKMGTATVSPAELGRALQTGSDLLEAVTWDLS